MDGLTTAAVAAGLVATAALPYAFVERRWRWRWREVEHGRIPADTTGGIYRAGGEVPRYYAEAPPLVRFTAFTCLLFGQLFVPIALVGFGLFWLILPFFAVTTAGKMYKAGFALLRRQPRDAYFVPRETAAAALWIWGVVLVLSPSLLLWRLPGAHRAAAFVAAFAFAWILQALLIRYVTRRYEDALFAGTDHP